MIAILALLVSVLVGLLITRFATIALVSTGMSRQYARFQARSAFTGVGFTTSEAEQVVNHPVRRRVILTLMLIGNAGIATLIATLLIGFSESDGADILRRGGVLAIGLTLIWLLAASSWVDRYARRVLAWFLGKRTGLQLRDYAGLLQIGADFDVGELRVGETDWLAGRSLGELSLRSEGVVVLGIERAGEYLGTPAGDVMVEADDTLVVYGHHDALAELDDRRSGPSGELAHIDRVIEHEVRKAADRDVFDTDAG